MDLGLEGKVALVTGASRGIGRAIALAFAREGALVAAIARSRDDLDETVQAMVGSQHCAVVADVTDPDRIAAAVDEATSTLGPIDIVVNNAGQRQDFGRLDELDVEYHIVEEDTYSIVKDLTPDGKTYCPICSRLRRGILYNRANVLGATKIALGHHLDDAVETLFLNMFFGGKMKSMPPKLLSDDGAHVVIRPLYYVRERDIARFSGFQQHPIIPCNLCGSQENMQRQIIKEMCGRWDEIQPGRVENIARAMQNLVPSHLADPNLFDFADLKQQLRLLPLAEWTASGTR